MTDNLHQPWTEKYRPTAFSHLQGNNAAIDRLKDWAKDFPNDRTPRLLVGPPGVGKTATVEVIADWLDLQMLEVNASDDRTGDGVKKMARAVQNTGADGERRVVLLDEVDSWHHATNKKPLYDALDAASNIVFLTANDEYDTPNGITNRVDTEKFKLGTRSIKAKLKKIADAEDIDLSDDQLDLLSDRPDLRTAINDLQTYGPVLDDLEADDRLGDINEWDMVDAYLSGEGPERGKHSPPDVLMWLDENITKDWRGLELAWGYEALSRADTLLGKAQTEGYGQWRYASAILDTIPDLRITEPYRKGTIGRDKDFPEWFRHSKPKPSGGSDEARLYRALSNYDTGEPGLRGGYVEFLNVHLPFLLNLQMEERCEFAFAHRLDPDEFAALDITKRQYEGWVEEDAPEQGEDLTFTESASAW